MNKINFELVAKILAKYDKEYADYIKTHNTTYTYLAMFSDKSFAIIFPDINANIGFDSIKEFRDWIERMTIQFDL